MLNFYFLIVSTIETSFYAYLVCFTLRNLLSNTESN